MMCRMFVDIPMIDITDDMLSKMPRGAKGFVKPVHYDIYRDLLYEIVTEQRPMTVRQVYYRAVVKGYIEKTEKGYGFVQRDIADMRRRGRIPYEWIIDESRSMRGWQGKNDDLKEWLKKITTDLPNTIAEEWSRNLLGDHEFSIQVWLEKEALIGVVHPMTSKWDVPLIPAKGYASLSLLYETAQDLEYKNRPAKIFHFGDYDPSGQDAIATVQRVFAPKTARLGIEFEIVAVTPEQIEEMNLPTRPTKKTDTRADRFGSDQSVELDAIEPNVLRQMVDETLQACFPPGALEANERQEEKETGKIYVGRYGGC
jgi:hypothetical protein